MIARPLRVLVVDDERPARKFLVGLLEGCPEVVVGGEASSGVEALDLLGRERLDLVLLDLQMPELGGLDVVRKAPVDRLPFVAFVTAFDEYAVEAFEVNAIDYLLKPVQRERLLATLDRTRERLVQAERPEQRTESLGRAVKAYEQAARRHFVERLPIRRRDEVMFLPVRQIAAIVAEGELLHITTTSNERHTISHRLHALEERLDPRRFVRLSRGTVVNIDAIARVSAMPGGTYLTTLSNGQELAVSRIQSRVLRDTLLKL